MRKKERPEDAKTIGVNPPKHVRILLKRAAAELDIPVSQFLYRSAVAICEMIDAREPRIPWIVTSTRVLRKHRAAATDPEQPFADHLVLDEPPAESASGSGEGAGKKNKRAPKANAPARHDNIAPAS